MLVYVVPLGQIAAVLVLAGKFKGRNSTGY